MMRPHKKRPARRLVTGVAGSPLSTVAAEPAQQRQILLHYCFNQERGEQKQPDCSCRHRVPLDEATGYVTENRADWLLVKNPKSSKLAKSGRAIVVRRVVIDSEILFGLPNPKPKIEPWERKQHNRDQKNRVIRAEVLGQARNLLRKWFSAGAVSQAVLDMNDDALERLLKSEPESQKFLSTLSPGRQTQWLARMTHYWNNILGYAKLNLDAGESMDGADHGTGATVSLGSSHHTEEVEGRHRTDSGRVIAANFVAWKLNGAFIYDSGAGPDQFDREPDLNEPPVLARDTPIVEAEPDIPGD